MFKINFNKIPGCFELLPKVQKDLRGKFVKVFHKEFFLQTGIETDFVEEYYSVSRKGVIRGMHFQLPPQAHAKLVYCIKGKVLDVILDLRKGSPAYGNYEVINMDADKANCVYIPKGLAHGFYAICDDTVMIYKVSTIYSPAHDAGILWNSFGMDWPINNPILSPRDQTFPPLSVFQTPFIYGAT
jgi:dTDP-4-dehydrorhamnose 3,5-epimerase